jgi:hypothetical protein
MSTRSEAARVIATKADRSSEEFNEAVTVVVTREGGDARIRELEWGRP